MSAQGLFSIGGIASGLDTENIISQLMRLERQPMRQIERRQDALRKVDDAWGQVNTKLSALRTASDALNRIDRFDGMIKVSSSNTDAVGVTRSGTTATGSQSFTVQQLATAQQSHAADTFEGRDATLDGRTLSITVGGETHDLTADLGADATLDDLVDAVNAAGIGVKASALQVSAGRFELVLEGQKSGEDNAFEVTATNWAAPFTTTQAAQDAKLSVGGVEVTRSSNTIDDLVDGAAITLKRVTDQAVTVTAERDVDGAVKAVGDYVKALNAALQTIKDKTAYDPETRTAGPLQGQAAASSLMLSLRSAVSAPVVGLGGGLGSLASSVGINTTRDGMLSFDEAAARKAFTDDFDGAARTLARSGSTTDPAATYLNGASRTQPGIYGVEVSQAADVARVTGSSYTPPDGDPKTFRVARPGREPVTVSISEGTSLAQAVGKINEALRAANVSTITASETEGGGILLEESRYGSAHGFTFEQIDANGDVIDDGVFGALTTEEGLDVVGTIDGEAATGNGRILSAVTGPADGLAIRVDGLPLDAFEVTYSRGVVGQVGAELAKAEGINGTVQRARSSIESQIDIYQTRLDGFEQRLETREATIRRQFTGMESMLHKLNSQGDWLTQQLTQLQPPPQRR